MFNLSRISVGALITCFCHGTLAEEAVYQFRQSTTLTGVTMNEQGRNALMSCILRFKPPVRAVVRYQDASGPEDVVLESDQLAIGWHPQAEESRFICHDNEVVTVRGVFTKGFTAHHSRPLMFWVEKVVERG